MLVTSLICKISSLLGPASSTLAFLTVTKILMFLQNFFSIFIFCLFCCFLSSIIFLVSYLLSVKASDTQKLSSYECGFNPFLDSRSEFDVRFYVVAILFLIFDLEISFLFPFIACFDGVGITGVFSMLFFLAVLLIGFFYE